MKGKSKKDKGETSVEGSSLIDNVVSEVNKKVGSNVASRASEGLYSSPKTLLSTGSFMVDLCLRGGVPTGRVIEIYGNPGASKTLLATHMMVDCQKKNGVVVLIDSESKFYIERARRIGLNVGSLIQLKAPSLEDGWNNIIQTVNAIKERRTDNDVPVLIVWDTISAPPTAAQLSQGKTEMIARPKVIKDGIQRILQMIQEENVCVVLINQIIIDPNKRVRKETAPGGKAKEHFCTQVLFLRNGGRIYDNDGNISGSVSYVQIEKNNLDGPMPTTDRIQLVVRDLDGIDDIMSMAGVFLAKEGDKKKENDSSSFMYRAGSWVKINSEKGVFSCYERDLVEVVIEHDLINELRREVAKKLLIQGEHGYNLWEKSNYITKVEEGDENVKPC